MWLGKGWRVSSEVSSGLQGCVSSEVSNGLEGRVRGEVSKPA